MKTLDQVQPRTLIDSLPFNITQSGSYYFTKNLNFTATSGNAITISVSNVTVDLMGFTLSSSSAVTGDAIRMNAGLRNISVSNGVIAGTTIVAISGSAPNQTWTITPGGFGNGINAFSTPEASSCQFTHLRISGCRGAGLDGGDQAVVDQVTATQNGSVGVGITTGTVTNSTGLSNGDAGINLQIGSVTNCTAASNQSFGIAGSSIINCTASNNGNSGILGFFGTASNSTSILNAATGIGFLYGTVTNCLSIQNKGVGISVSNGSVMNSTAVSNGDDGINAPSGVVAFCKASGNNTSSNGSSDIDAAGSTRTGNYPTP
jgi:hypothetical protein